MPANERVLGVVGVNAEYLVTHDKDFDILEQIEFPKVTVIDTDEFKRVLFD